MSVRLGESLLIPWMDIAILNDIDCYVTMGTRNEACCVLVDEPKSGIGPRIVCLIACACYTI